MDIVQILHLASCLVVRNLQAKGTYAFQTNRISLRQFFLHKSCQINKHSLYQSLVKMIPSMHLLNNIVMTDHISSHHSQMLNLLPFVFRVGHFINSIFHNTNIC